MRVALRDSQTGEDGGGQQQPARRVAHAGLLLGVGPVMARLKRELGFRVSKDVERRILEPARE
ncbi:MAG TPA: hypothetical protein VGM03_09735 [Phycisphaerae bacterium]